MHVHLRELVDAGLLKGRPEVEAVASAIRRFGPPGEVSHRLNVVSRPVARPKVEWGKPGRAVWQVVAAMALLSVCLVFTHPSTDIVRALSEFARTGDLRLIDTGGTRAYPGLYALTCLGLIAVTLSWRHARKAQYVWAGGAFALAIAMPVWLMRSLAWYVRWIDDEHIGFRIDRELGYWSIGSSVAVPLVLVAGALLPRALRWIARAKWQANAVVLIAVLAAAALWASPVGFGMAGGYRGVEVRIPPDLTVTRYLTPAEWPLQLAKLLGCLGVVGAASQLAGRWMARPKSRPSQAALIAAMASLVASPIAACTADLGSITVASLVTSTLAHAILMAAGAATLSLAGSVQDRTLPASHSFREVEAA